MATDQLKELKLYMHVDHDADDVTIKRLWGAAIEYLEDGGIPQDGSNLVWLATAGLTLHWFDHPEVEGTETNISLGLRGVINQLKMKYGGVDYF